MATTSMSTPWGRAVLLAVYFLATLGASSGVFDEALKHQEKQLLLDLHNSYRAAVQASNMKRLVRNDRSMRGED